MSAQKKQFRIESLMSPAALVDAANDSGVVPGAGYGAILAEIKALRALIEPAETVSQSMIDTYRAEMAEAAKLKAELDKIYVAINETKHEIATLHVSGFKGKEMARVTHELDAIVDGTEGATEGILSAAEHIDQLASQLSASLKSTQDKAAVDDIQQRVVAIFEQCNFQDLTGQRITKVVNTLKFIEDRIVKMMDIWGGLDSFRDIEVEVIAEREGDAALLNGPKLDSEVGHASQDDIDALFA